MTTYAGFWSRLTAHVIDALILAPVTFLLFWGDATSRTWAIATIPLGSVVGLGYQIYFHGRFGQTIGKRVAGVRVVRLDGAPISWREAWLRSSVGITLAVIGGAGVISVLLHLPPAHFALHWIARSKDLVHAEPIWLRRASNANEAWHWGELIVMLSNRKRRALHDFLAGTVVVSDRRSVVPTGAA